MEIRDHRIIKSHLKREAVKVPPKHDGGEWPKDSYVPSDSSQAKFPDLSGLAKFSKNRLVGVKDTKLEDDSQRVVLLDKKTGNIENLDMDWSKTGRARDLEAITPTDQNGNFLAVEGSSYQEHKARLFELSLNEEGGQAKKSHVLPSFGQEIEGLLSLPGKNGSKTILFGGRGDENGQSRVFWGTLSDKGLEFSAKGLEGQQIQSPRLGEGQRSIADMTLDEKGKLYATAVIDNGDQGPFDSVVYQAGQLSGNAGRPLDTSRGQGVALKGTKAEALVAQGQGMFFSGSDNESLGGRFEQFRLTDQYA